MDRYLKKNQQHWDEITPINYRSEHYDVKGFESGRMTLRPVELEEVGNVTGKSLLHLQCHFGMDTLSWARLGARVTGVDFSRESITMARSLSARIGVEATFVQSDIYDLPQVLDGQFDIAFTSWGVLCWLPDLIRWGQIIVHFLKKGGMFYMIENHPYLNVFECGRNVDELRPKYSYFSGRGPTEYPPDFDYAGPEAKLRYGDYEWTHPLSEVLNALITAGLRIEFVHEFPVLCFKENALCTQDGVGWWRLEGDRLPLSFSVKATKPTQVG